MAVSGQVMHVRDFSLRRKAEMVSSKLEMIAQVKSPAEEDILIKDQMANVVELIEDLENISLSLRQKVNRFYDIMMSVKAKNFSSGNGDGMFLAKYAPRFKETISIEVFDYFVKITMFPLIANVSAKTKYFITQCINDAISDFKSDPENPDLKKLSAPGVLVICNKRPAWDRVYDADNVEINSIVNALTTHFFTDDSPKYLSIYRMGMETSEASTEIFLMYLADFPAWVESCQTVL